MRTPTHWPPCYTAAYGGHAAGSADSRRTGYAGARSPAAKGRSTYSPKLLAAIDAALTLDPAARPDGVQALLAALVDSPPAARKQRRSARAPAADDDEGAAGRAPRRWHKAALGAAAAALVAVVGIFVVQRGDWAAVDERGDQPTVIAPSETGPPPPVAQDPEPAPADAAETAAEGDGPALVDAPPPTPVPQAEGPPPRTASLVLVTQPPGAEILLDGEPVGETPLEVEELAARVYGVTIRHPHYDAVETELDLSPGESKRFEAELARATGTLRVTTTPPGAWIERNGERLADSSPATLAGLPAGSISLTLGAPHHVTAEVAAEVAKDDTTTVASAWNALLVR